MLDRVIAYVDGFNLYFGLKEKGWKRQYWLDVAELAENLLKPRQQLVGLNYFTARISGTRAKRDRQTAYLEALKEMGKCHMHFGVYRERSRECKRCKLVDRYTSPAMVVIGRVRMNGLSIEEAAKYQELFPEALRTYIELRDRLRPEEG